MNKTPQARLDKNKAYRIANKAKVYAKQLEHQRANKEMYNASGRRCRRKLRDEVLHAYGDVCDCCGENEKDFLEVDHIMGGGNKHRKELGGGAKLYTWLRKNKFPLGFRLLCKNCNGAIFKLGWCPHELARVAYA